MQAQKDAEGIGRLVLGFLGRDSSRLDKLFGGWER